MNLLRPSPEIHDFELTLALTPTQGIPITLGQEGVHRVGALGEVSIGKSQIGAGDIDLDENPFCVCYRRYRSMVNTANTLIRISSRMLLILDCENSHTCT